MSTQQTRARFRQLEARIWTGRAGHLLGGALDVLEALARYALARARAKRAR